jgi:hypothetical protein
VLKNPGNRRSSKNGVVITLALFGVERAIGDAARLACRTTVRRAVPPAKNSESASAASAIVIGPKIGVFQHNTSIRDFAQTSQMRKHRSFADGLVNGSNRRKGDIRVDTEKSSVIPLASIP